MTTLANENRSARGVGERFPPLRDLAQKFCFPCLNENCSHFMVTGLAHWDRGENHQSLITLVSRWIIQTAFPTHGCNKSFIETQTIHHQALLAERCFYHLFCDLIVWPICLIKGMKVVVLDILQIETSRTSYYTLNKSYKSYCAFQ